MEFVRGSGRAGLFFAAWGKNELARGTIGIGSSLSNFVVQSLSWFQNKLLHCGEMIQRRLISQSLATLQHVLSPGSLTPWHASPLHGPDPHGRTTTPLPRAPRRARSCHGRKSSGSGHAKASCVTDRDHQPPAPDREVAGPGCH